MKRREFISLLGGAAAWPLAARAQQHPMPVIGFLNARSPEDTMHLVAAFRRGLGQGGFVEGQNVIIEYRWALGQYDRLAGMATELAHRPVMLLATAGGEPAGLAAKAATSTIPIVFVIGGDPVKQGLATSLNQPGGNSTGVSILTTTLGAKRLGLLRELMPGAATIGALLNPSFPLYESQLRDVQEAAHTLALQLVVLPADTDREIEAAFETVVQQRIPALSVAAAPFFDTRRDKLVALAARHAVPTMYQFREFVAAGGLVSYGIDVADAYRQIGLYAARILKGEKPADLPVVQPTKFELVINLNTARALSLEIPPKVLALADEVIE
jgi:putative tryptophan/tyrosine transport system substrate-binding protein